MKQRKSYVGKLNGVMGVWCDKKPRGLEVEKTNIFYVPDEGKTFKKGDEYFDIILTSEGQNVEDYEEVDLPEETQE